MKIPQSTLLLQELLKKWNERAERITEHIRYLKEECYLSDETIIERLDSERDTLGNCINDLRIVIESRLFIDEHNSR